MKEIKKILVSFMCLVFILNGNIIAFGEEANNGPKDVKAFEQMADSYMKKAMKEYKVPNVTVCVVKDGKLFFKKGYGYADIEKKKLQGEYKSPSEVVKIKLGLLNQITPFFL